MDEELPPTQRVRRKTPEEASQFFIGICAFTPETSPEETENVSLMGLRQGHLVTVAVAMTVTMTGTLVKS